LSTQIALPHSAVDEVATLTERSAVTGGLVGGIAGFAASLLGFSIPVVGPLVAVSPMVTALTGAGAGALVGGLIGALMEGEFSPQRAARELESMWREQAPVTVRPDVPFAADRGDVAADRGAREIDLRISHWRDSGWAGWNASAAPATPDEAERERRLYGMHADPLTGLPLTADPERENALETTIRR